MLSRAKINRRYRSRSYVSECLALDARLGPSGGLVQLSLQEPLWREVGQVGGDPDAASVELQQLDVLVSFVGAGVEAKRRPLAGLS